MSQRIRRVRGTVASTEEAQDILQSIAHDERKRKLLADNIALSEARLFKLMQKGKIATVAIVGAEATIVRSAGKAQNLIDPKGLQKKLAPADFFECITVSVTKTKEFLSAKDLAAITTTLPGTVGEPKLKVVVK